MHEVKRWEPSFGIDKEGRLMHGMEEMPPSSTKQGFVSEADYAALREEHESWREVHAMNEQTLFAMQGRLEQAKKWLRLARERLDMDNSSDLWLDKQIEAFLSPTHPSSKEKP